MFDCCAIPVRVLLLGQQRKRTVGSNTRRTPGEIAEMDFGRLGTLMHAHAGSTPGRKGLTVVLPFRGDLLQNLLQNCVQR